MPLDQVVSSPRPGSVILDDHKAFHFGAAEEQGRREQQEDALVAAWFQMGEFNSLSTKDLAYRLWTAHKSLNAIYIKSSGVGSTASTTVFDGEDTLVTATIGDSEVFAVVYENNRPFSVTRLNRIIHHPNAESERVIRQGGVIINGRMHKPPSSHLALSRALGDFSYLDWGLCDDPHIDIHSLTDLTLGNKTFKVQIITVCDGFTEPARNDTKAEHEFFLRDALWNIPDAAKISESGLAERLCDYALNKGSFDNVSVLIQTVSTGMPFLNGVYDGHGGSAEVAVTAAGKILELFQRQCGLSREHYEKQALSVHKNFIKYHRDNPDKVLYNSLAEREITSRIKQLQQRSGICEKIEALRDARNQLINKLATADESAELYTNGLLAVERLLLFLDGVNQKYTDLLLEKHEVVECVQSVFEAKTVDSQKIMRKHGFASFGYNMADDVLYLKRTHELGKVLESLMNEFHSTLNPRPPAIATSAIPSRTGVFGPRSPSSPRSPLSRRGSPSGLTKIEEDPDGDDTPAPG